MITFVITAHTTVISSIGGKSAMEHSNLLIRKFFILSLYCLLYVNSRSLEVVLEVLRISVAAICMFRCFDGGIANEH